MANALLQFLDTVGDGSGSISGAVNGSVTPVELSLAPPSSVEYRVRHLTILVEDNASLLGDVFGAAALTNGIRLRVLNGSDVSLRDLDGGVAIKRLASIMALGATVEVDETGTNKFRAFRLAFDQEIVLNGNTPARLAVTISDDLSNLVGLTFLAEGISRGQLVA